MKEFYDRYIETCFQRIHDSDYGDKKKVRQHNNAMDKLLHMRKEVEDIEPSVRNELYQRLLTHKDDRVRIAAAVDCVLLGFLCDEAVVVLADIEQNCTDKILRFNSHMFLEGFCRPDSMFYGKW